MDRYISGVDMITGLGVMDKDTDRRHIGWYKADDVDKKMTQLRKALKVYGWHLHTCPSYDHICAPCDCKFEQILKEEEDE